MRTKKLLALVLAVALVMSCAMTASAGTLYYSQDFSEYAEDITTMADDLHVDTSIRYYGADKPAGDVDATRTAKKNIMTSWAGVATTACQISTNAFDNNQFETLNFIGGDYSMAFIADESWNAATKTNETYIIALDFCNTKCIFASQGMISVIGKDGEDYKAKIIINGTNNNPFLVTGTDYYSGVNLGFTTGTTKRVAIGFNYDATNSEMTRTVSVDGTHFTAGANTFIEGLTTIEGFGLYEHSNAITNIGDIKMYTISGDFGVTAPVDGSTVVDPSTAVIPVTFTHPVAENTFAASDVTMTKDGVAFDGYSVGNISTATVNGSYVSTVDVTVSLEEYSDYVITVAGVTNELGASLTDGTIEFSTPKANIEAVISAGTHTVGSLSEVTATIANDTAAASKNVALIYAVYDENGTLLDVVYANESVAKGTTATITAGVKLPATANKAKVMLWDGISSIKPYTTISDSISVAAE